ncbi:MAG: UDP-N-acetylmuramate dehydrogenase [Lachnospiraceae bacterium]|nr:UDP-N-acetylmuramate dehydrogenase [Lachnospiraceae bacterium]MDE6603824.1 UDP-N-acetylmuramate dehydrogenase [Lachnospiraceae bacterium]MDE7358667.1 UDP-N-acetylmuramate dehydrogenase [Lachnospiraceae bacterium]
MYEHIRTIVPDERLMFHEPMSRHTTFRVGGEAECMAVVETKEELSQLVSYLGRVEQEYFVLGNGSNLLVGDKGYRGIILKLGPRLSAVGVEKDHIAAGAGALLSQVASAARDAGLSGLEFAAGIPGSIGGAIVMNAGAYGGEMKQVVKMVRVMDKEGEILTLDNDTMEFGYRTSIIRNRPFIVLGVVLKLTSGNKEEISAKMEELMKQRKSKQPLEYPSAGSTFKRPEGHYAGKLIMDAGLRGYRIGGAQVSEKHCGFVINAGGASAADIREVIEEVRERVLDRFHVRLEPEVIFLGDF